MFIIFVASLLISSVAGSSYYTYYLDEYCYQRSQLLALSMDETLSDFSSMLLTTTRFGGYKNNQNCTVSVTAPAGHGITLTVQKIDFFDYGAECVDYIQIYNTNTGNVEICEINKEKFEDSSLYFSDGRLKFIYHSEQRRIIELLYLKGFEIALTTFRNASCSLLEFQCGNSLCISRSYKCDGYNNCGDFSDEENCDTDEDSETASPMDLYVYDPSMSNRTKIVLIIFLVSIGCLSLGGLVCMVRRKSIVYGTVISRSNLGNIRPYPPPYTVEKAVVTSNCGNENQKGTLKKDHSVSSCIYPSVSVSPKRY